LEQHYELLGKYGNKTISEISGEQLQVRHGLVDPFTSSRQSTIELDQVISKIAQPHPILNAFSPSEREIRK
jgi:hypothetical protein